jgi:hypothetical protein
MAGVSWSMSCGAACPHVVRCDDKRHVTLSGPVTMSRQSVMSQGFAFGTGSAVAHNVVGSMFGGSSSSGGSSDSGGGGDGDGLRCSCPIRLQIDRNRRNRQETTDDQTITRS